MSAAVHYSHAREPKQIKAALWTCNDRAQSGVDVCCCAALWVSQRKGSVLNAHLLPVVNTSLFALALQIWWQPLTYVAQDDMHLLQARHCCLGCLFSILVGQTQHPGMLKVQGLGSRVHPKPQTAINCSISLDTLYSRQLLMLAMDARP